jgi:hypothetical protein
VAQLEGHDCVPRERRPRRLCAGLEQGERCLVRQRADGVHRLASDAKRCAARRQDAQVRTRDREQLGGNLGDRNEKVLAVVEH